MRRPPFFVLLLVLGACGIRLGGDPSHPAASPGKPCEAPSDCPSAPSCHVAACVEGGCRVEVAPAGTVPAEQVEGDCRTLVCDGRGQAVARADGADVPADDGNACTEERCAGDRAEHAPLAAGQPCGRGGVCNGAGVCGVCAPGEGKCEEGVPSLCEPSGQWQRAERRCDGDVPVCFAGTCAPASALALGPAATCVLTPAGTRCDGSADAALLSMERRVKILDGARDLAVGRRHACALRADGAVFCWGDGSRGQLGGGPSGALVRVVGGAEQVAAGDAHTCARLRVGAVACWGADDRGQLGDGAGKAEKNAPQPPAPGETRSVHARIKWARLAIGTELACGLHEGGTVECWGSAASAPGPEVAPPPPAPPLPAKPAGRAKPAPKSPPPSLVRRVAGVQDTVEIATHGAHTCARHRDGGVSCWGGDRLAPARVAGIQHAIGLAVGRAHACALLTGGRLACWGENAAGQLGDGTKRARQVPVVLDEVGPSREVAAAGDHTCLLPQGKSLPFCWGDGAAAPATFR